MSLQRMMTDDAFIENEHGGRNGPYKTKFGSKKLVIYNDKLVVSEGDIVIQPLPNGTEERFVVTEAQFSSGLRGRDAHYLISIIKESKQQREQVNASIQHRSPKATVLSASSSVINNVFIVHGHDELCKTETARFVESLGLNATILHEQTSSSQTIIEKFERHASEAAFAIVLLTPDDVGYAKGSPNNAKPRARQNVVFELGYFCSALSRGKVCVLYKEDVEIPNDFSGVIYTQMDNAGAWKLSLAREMKAAGLNIDLNRVL